MNSLVAAAAALTTTVLIASGCASTDTTGTTTEAPRGELVYRTGSNIPVREKASTTKEEQDKQSVEAQRVLQQMQTTGAGNPRTN